MSKERPPTLLVVGEKDFPTLEGDARRLADKAKGLAER
jgi:hypothetical protein